MQGIGYNIPLSGLNAASTQLAAAANNIANANNSTYVPQDAVQSTDPQGGVHVNIRNGPPQSQNDPAGQEINAEIATYNFQANLNVLKVQNRLSQDVLNITA